MIVTTTNTIQGHEIQEYLGVVAGEAILGVNVFRDIGAGIRNIIGGRSSGYEEELGKARAIAQDEMLEAAAELGANAVLGVDIDYENIGQSGGMLMVTMSGTAVRY